MCMLISLWLSSSMSGTIDNFDYGGNIWAFVKLIVQYVTYLYQTPLFSQVPFICFLDSPFLPPLDHNCQSLWDTDIDLIMFLKVFTTTSFRFLNLKMNLNWLRSYWQFFTVAETNYIVTLIFVLKTALVILDQWAGANHCYPSLQLQF